MSQTLTHISEGWKPDAVWLEAECVVLTRCACGTEIRLDADKQPTELALVMAGMFACDECAEGD